MEIHPRAAGVAMFAVAFGLFLCAAGCNRSSGDDNGSSPPPTQTPNDQSNGKRGDQQPALQLTDSGATLSIKIDRALATAAGDNQALLTTRQLDVGDFEAASVYVIVDPTLVAQSCYYYYDSQNRIRKNFGKFAVRTLFGMDDRTFAASNFDLVFDSSHLGMTKDGKFASVSQIPSLPGKFMTFWINTLSNESGAMDESASERPMPAPPTSTNSGSSSASSPTPTPTPVDNTPECKGEIQFRVYGKHKN